MKHFTKMQGRQLAALEAAFETLLSDVRKAQGKQATPPEPADTLPANARFVDKPHADSLRLWQPIETAPTDGTRVLLWFQPNEVTHCDHKSFAAAGYWKRFQWKNGLQEPVGEPWWMWQSESCPDDERMAMSFAPTHWQPLPLAPGASAVEKPHPDKVRLDWLLKLIDHKGTDGIAKLPWTVKEWNGEDSRIKFDRKAIDAAMRQPSEA